MDHRCPEKIRLGIIGCGAITESSHLPTALTSRVAQLTALCDQNERQLRLLQRQFGVQATGYHDYRELIPHVDAVILALPNHLHARVGRELLSKGIHVLCEKPLGTSRAECEQLCEAARAGKATLAVGYFTRFYLSTELTKHLLETHFLGDITSFDYEHFPEGGWDPISGYNLTRATAGGGVLVVNGSHFIDRMLFLFGPARVVSYADDSRGGIEANCVATFECALHGQPLRGQVTLSKTHALGNRLRIVGQAGTLEIGDNQTRSVTYYPAGSPLRHEISSSAATPPGEDNYFQWQLEDFVRAIQTGSEPKVSGAWGRQSVELMEHCYQMATALEEPWVDGTLDRLRPALPADPRPTITRSAGRVAVP